MISYGPLWETMKRQGATTYTLECRGPVVISSSTVRRLKAGESVSTNTLDALCQILDWRTSSPISRKHRPNNHTEVYIAVEGGIGVIVFDRLWATMKRRGISQYRLIQDYQFSSGQLDRLRKNASVSTYTLDQLCKILDCGLDEIAEFLPEGDEPNA